MSVHAVLSPSSSDRWLNCPGSVQASAEHGTGSSNLYAEEGTAAHALLEMCLRLHNRPEEFEGMVIHKYVKPDGTVHEFTVDGDMMLAVGHAYDYITQWQAAHPKGKVMIETRVHWGAHPLLKLDKDTASGTADVILIDATPRTRALVMMDYKHGAGVMVEVEDNSQLMLYAVGTLIEHPTFDNLELCVVQPRARHADGPIRHWAISRDKLDKWVKDTVAPACKRAMKPNGPRTAGRWCKWCSAAPTCRALLQHVMDTAGTEFDAIDTRAPQDPDTLSDDELARAMQASVIIEAWIHAVRGRVLNMLRGGAVLPGWKLVLGRSTRQWPEDDDEINALLAKVHSMLGDPKLYAPRQLLSPAQLEKVFTSQRRGPEFRAQLVQFIRRSTPDVHVAPEHDPRDEYQPGSEFSNLDGS